MPATFIQGFLLVIAKHPKPQRPKRDRDLSVASIISNSFNEQFNDPGLIARGKRLPNRLEKHQSMRQIVFIDGLTLCRLTMSWRTTTIRCSMARICSCKSAS